MKYVNISMVELRDLSSLNYDTNKENLVNQYQNKMKMVS